MCHQNNFKLNTICTVNTYTHFTLFIFRDLRPTYILPEQTNDARTNKFQSGSNVISGLYFEHGTGVLKYNMIPMLVGLVYADVVFHAISNKRNMKTIELSNDDNIKIQVYLF